MQSTLMRLMKKKGLRRDPFQKLVTTAITPVEENFTYSPPGNFSSFFNFFFVCRVHTETGIGYAPASGEPAFYFKTVF